MLKQSGAATCLISLLFLFLTACRTKQEGFTLIPKQKLILAGAPEISLNTFGFIKDRDGDLGYYYFADPQTRKKVYFYDEQGRLADTIRLPKLLPKDERVNSVAAQSMDSMMMMSAHDNYFYVFGKGKLHSTADLEPTLYENRNYIVSRVGYVDFSQDVAYTITWLDFTRLKRPDTIQNQTKYDYNLIYRGPLIARITHLNADTPKVALLLDHFLTRFIPDTIIGGISKTYAFSKEAIYGCFPESDTLYKFDNTGKLVQSAQIRPSYANIKAAGCTLGSDIQAYANQRWEEKSMIGYMDYDPYRKLLYLRYYFEVPSTAKPIEKGEHRKWALLVYDEQLRKVGELPFEADSYNPMSLIATPKGLLLEKINTNKDASSNREFQLFEVAYRPL